MVTYLKNHLESRSSNYLRKYRIFFVFGIILLSAQVYLAYSFFSIENEVKEKGPNYVLKEVESGESKPSADRQIVSGTKFPKRSASGTTVKLDLRTLNFVPNCEITSKEAISAINRAQTHKCKEYLANVTCQNQQRLLYPVKLRSKCPHSLGFGSEPENLGCFMDNGVTYLLSSYRTILKNYNGPEYCANICLQSGFPYAGVKNAIECFCGLEPPAPEKRLPHSSCDMACSGNPEHTCGGYTTIDIFSTGIKKFQPQVARNASNAEKKPSARVAYLLTINGRASRQVKRLINALNHPSHFFYVHVDARQDYLFREMLRVEKNCPTKNIFIARAPHRFASIWGGASLLTTFLTSARQMLAHFKDWDFLINLSESDFPIKQNTKLVEFLGANKGFNFVKSHGREVQRFLSKQGLDKTFVECEARMWRIGNRRLPDGIQLDGGSDWVALSRNFVEYVSNLESDPLVSSLLQVFSHTLLPAESFFHTVLRNSEFCDTYVDNNLHVTNWKRKLGCKCQYKAIVDWCGCSPNDFKEEDFQRILNTEDRNLYFGRKFEPVVDQRIIEKLEQWLYPNRVNNTKAYEKYWQSIYHHEDLSPLVDDTVLTISNSLVRFSRNFLGIGKNSAIQLIETSSYFTKNRYTGLLVRSKIVSSDVESSVRGDYASEIEALIQIKHNFTVTRSWFRKLTRLSVNTDYDQKELLFRNFVGGIGPMSSPVLGYVFDASGTSTPQNLTVIWVDPQKTIAEVSSLTIDEASLIGHLNPQLEVPLLTGVWQVFVIFNDKMIARTQFLVIPLTHWKNKPINYETATDINHTPIRTYRVTKEMASKWQKFLKSQLKSEESSAAIDPPSEVQISRKLEDWVDSLVSRHYKVEEICLVSKKPGIGTKLLQKCSDTEWSSLSPDPKSDICSPCTKK